MARVNRLFKLKNIAKCSCIRSGNRVCSLASLPSRAPWTLTAADLSNRFSVLKYSAFSNWTKFLNNLKKSRRRCRGVQWRNCYRSSLIWALLVRSIITLVYLAVTQSLQIEISLTVRGCSLTAAFVLVSEVFWNRRAADWSTCATEGWDLWVHHLQGKWHQRYHCLWASEDSP